MLAHPAGKSTSRPPRHGWWWLALCLALVAWAPVDVARAGPSATTAAPHSPLPPDRRTALPARRPDAARLRDLAAQRAFRYTEPEASPNALDSLWVRLRRRLLDLLTSPTGRTTGKYALYAGMVAALVFAVLKLLQVDLTGAFGRAVRRGALAYDTAAENIHDVDFPARIAEAEAAGNFRLATRLGYLEVLKSLTDRGLIEWQPDKTNHAYLAEVGAGPLREAFRRATREFEYVWYGELRLSPALYAQARASQRAAGTLAAGSPAPAVSASTNALPA